MTLKLKNNTNIEAILVVHYFGFFSNVNDIVSLCKTFKVKVIEDCAHGFLSSHNNTDFGSFGDISIFSMRKTLPVSDGGALIINNSEHKVLDPCENNTFYSVRNITYLCSRLLEKLIISLRINIYGKTVNDFKNKLRDNSSPEKKIC